MFVFKKIVALLAGPLMLALVVLLTAGLLRTMGRRRASAWAVCVAGIMIYLASTASVGNALLGSLERQYPPFPANLFPKMRYVVVLGSGYAPRGGIPVTGALDPDGLARVVEGVRLLRYYDSARLVVSGGAPAGASGSPSAFGYRDLARQLGVADASMLVLDAPLDTKSEAVEISAKLGQAPFILVTSAYHMPRAMRLMQASGAQAVPAPTAQRVNDELPWSWRAVLPTVNGLDKTERALHEYIGLAALAMDLG